MKQSENQKSLAWFKLAEFVQRGEKERALGVYKLLALSLEDLAFAHQLEGDILLAFDDQGAKAKYFQAAQIYLSQNNFMAALGTLNHLALLEPTNLIYWQMLTDLYLDHYLDKSYLHLKNIVNCEQIQYAQECLKLIAERYKQKNLTAELTVFLDQVKKLNLNLWI